MRAARWMMAGSVLALVLAAANAARADVVISSKATANMSCAAGVCSPTAKKAVLNVTDLTNMLASGDVTVTTGAGATNIVVKDGFSWTSTSRLTLDAIQSVEFDKKVAVAGTGAVTITVNDGGSGGDLLFDGKGNLTFWDVSSSLIVNGNSYTLVKDIATLASDIAANPSGFYAFANDYDASVDGTYSSAPMPGTFTGVFEGIGHEISNLKIDSSDFAVGFFGAVQGGVLRDIGLRKIAITGTSPIIGSLLGESSQAMIIRCYASGSIVAGSSSVVVGGLVGKSSSIQDGNIIRSHTAITVNAPDAVYVGGLVGSSGFTISQSFASGSVKAGDNSGVGGLVGTMSGAAVTESYANGSARGGENSTLGGLLGIGNGNIENSYATGAVKGAGSAIVGGFAGQMGGTIFSSYSIGHVGGGKMGSSGGFLGTGRGGGLDSDYWDIDTSGKGRGDGCGNSKCGRGAKGLTTGEFQAGLPSGFDPKIWGEKTAINGGFPYLLNNPPPKSSPDDEAEE